MLTKFHLCRCAPTRLIRSSTTSPHRRHWFFLWLFLWLVQRIVLCGDYSCECALPLRSGDRTLTVALTPLYHSDPKFIKRVAFTRTRLKFCTANSNQHPGRSIAPVHYLRNALEPDTGQCSTSARHATFPAHPHRAPRLQLLLRMHHHRCQAWFRAGHCGRSMGF